MRTQPFEEKMLQFMGDNKRLIHFHERKLSDLEAFKFDTSVSEEYKCLIEKLGDTSRAAGPEYAKSEQGYIS